MLALLLLRKGQFQELILNRNYNPPTPRKETDIFVISGVLEERSGSEADRKLQLANLEEPAASSQQGKRREKFNVFSLKMDTCKS